MDQPREEFFLLERSNELMGYKFINRIMELEREGWEKREDHDNYILFARKVGGKP